MRTKRLLLSIFAFPLLLAACGDPLFAPPAGFGVVEGRWNEGNWAGYGWAVLVSDTLYLNGRMDIGGAESQELRVKIPFNGVGTYQLNGSNSAIAIIIGGDAATVFPATGTMVLSDYDGNFAVGNFNMTAQLPGGTVTFAGRRFDVPVFFNFVDVPQFPTD